MSKWIFILFLISNLLNAAHTQTGADRLIGALKEHSSTELFNIDLRNKRVGIITNQTGRTRDGKWTLDQLIELSKDNHFEVTVIFALEHGVKGNVKACGNIEDS